MGVLQADPKVKEFQSKKSAPAPNFSQSSSEPATPVDDDIPVDSIVLAAKSSVLNTLLSNGMKESDKSVPVIVKVTLEGER